MTRCLPGVALAMLSLDLGVAPAVSQYELRSEFRAVARRIASPGRYVIDAEVLLRGWHHLVRPQTARSAETQPVTRSCSHGT
jgi:hypothetical protein